MNSFIITSSGINLFFDVDSSQHTIKSDHPRYSDICKMAVEGRFDEILSAIDIKSAVDKFIYASNNGRFSIKDGNLNFDGESMHSSLADRMIDMAMRGLDITAMENFMVNLMLNPSYRAVTELYNFLEAGNLPITSDGHFLAYKKIRDDYTDCHTGTFDNSIGSLVTMQRNKVNEDRNQTCSTGLHFCSYDYLNQFGGSRVVILKINPRDVVSIPSDYRDTKGRCCSYTVIRELENWVGDRIEGFVSDDGMYDEEDDHDGTMHDEEDDHDGTIYDDGIMYDDEDDDSPINFVDIDLPEIGLLTDEPEFYIKAVDLRNKVTYEFADVEEAHRTTQVPLEFIIRATKGQSGNTLGYSFEEVEK